MLDDIIEGLLESSCGRRFFCWSVGFLFMAVGIYMFFSPPEEATLGFWTFATTVFYTGLFVLQFVSADRRRIKMWVFTWLTLLCLTLALNGLGL